jgi:hypothetical protein
MKVGHILQDLTDKLEQQQDILVYCEKRAPHRLLAEKRKERELEQHQVRLWTAGCAPCAVPDHAVCPQWWGYQAMVQDDSERDACAIGCEALETFQKEARSP